jgi:CubicO group peptidase (beta-lactamase class C family)
LNTTRRSATRAEPLRPCGWRLSLILVLVFSGCVEPRPSETSTTAVVADAALGARMDAAAAAALREILAAGFSVAVVDHGQPVLAKGYGYADLAEEVPASANTIYRLASITKQFTAAAILHLADEGKLSLEDRISDYLPEYPASGQRITIRNLLSHTSGLSVWRSSQSSKRVAWDTPGTRSSTWSLCSRSTSSRGRGIPIATWDSCSPGW